MVAERAGQVTRACISYYLLYRSAFHRVLIDISLAILAQYISLLLNGCNVLKEKERVGASWVIKV